MRASPKTNLYRQIRIIIASSQVHGASLHSPDFTQASPLPIEKHENHTAVLIAPSLLKRYALVNVMLDTHTHAAHR